MKPIRFFLAAILLVQPGHAFCQSTTDYDKVQLVAASDYKPAEGLVLKAAEHVLSTAISDNNTERLKSMQFVIKWMSGTPDYNFNLNGSVLKIIKKNDDLIGVYMAALVSSALQHPEIAKDDHQLQLQALGILADYCKNDNNNVKMTKPIRNLIEQKDKNTLEELLK